MRFRLMLFKSIKRLFLACGEKYLLVPAILNLLCAWPFDTSVGLAARRIFEGGVIERRATYGLRGTTRSPTIKRCRSVIADGQAVAPDSADGIGVCRAWRVSDR